MGSVGLNWEIGSSAECDQGKPLFPHLYSGVAKTGAISYFLFYQTYDSKVLEEEMIYFKLIGN